MKEQLANMTIIELVRTGHSYAASIQSIETYSAIVTEMGSRLEALNLAHIAAMNNLRSSTSTNDSLAAENVALQSERDHLAAQLADVVAENAALKALNEDRRVFIMNGVQLGYIKVPTVETDPALETIRIAVSPQEKTPATDSFLAEQRAIGVEMFADYILCPDLDEEIRGYAAQLRNEVKV